VHNMALRELYDVTTAVGKLSQNLTASTSKMLIQSWSTWTISRSPHGRLCRYREPFGIGMSPDIAATIMASQPEPRGAANPVDDDDYDYEDEDDARFKQLFGITPLDVMREAGTRYPGGTVEILAWARAQDSGGSIDGPPFSHDQGRAGPRQRGGGGGGGRIQPDPPRGRGLWDRARPSAHRKARLTGAGACTP